MIPHIFSKWRTKTKQMYEGNKVIKRQAKRTLACSLGSTANRPAKTAKAMKKIFKKKFISDLPTLIISRYETEPQVFFLRPVKTWTSLNTFKSKCAVTKRTSPLYRVSRKRLQYIQLIISGHRKSTQVLKLYIKLCYRLFIFCLVFKIFRPKRVSCSPSWIIEDIDLLN